MTVHLIDGWQIENLNRMTSCGPVGRASTDESDKLGSRPAIEIADVTIPGRRGVTPSFVSLPGEQFYRLVIVCKAATLADARLMVAEIHRRLPPRRLVTLSRVNPGFSVQAPARVVAKTETVSENRTNTVIKLTLLFSLPGGVWLDTSEIVATVPSGTSALAVLAGGSAGMESRFLIHGNGGTTSVQIIDVETGSWWRIDGNIPAGQPVMIDPLAHTAAAGETDYVPLLTVGPHAFYLSPNALINQVRNGSQETQIIARRSWYE